MHNSRPLRSVRKSFCNFPDFKIWGTPASQTAYCSACCTQSTSKPTAASRSIASTAIPRSKASSTTNLPQHSKTLKQPTPQVKDLRAHQNLFTIRRSSKVSSTTATSSKPPCFKTTFAASACWRVTSKTLSFRVIITGRRPCCPSPS